MELSIVSTLYRSAPYLREFCARALAAGTRASGDCELILVDDGSPDESCAIARELCRNDPRIGLVELSRNFGHHKAILTGLAYARGRRVFLIDCDLEEAPEWLGRFDREQAETGADVVYGVQEARKGGLFERWSGRAFYRALRVLTAEPVPANMVTARLMTREYVRALVRHRDREVFLAGLWSTTGFRQAGLPVAKRSKGTTTYTLRRKLAILVNAVTSFSNRPLVGIFYLGCAILAGSSAAALLLAVRHIFFGEYLAGWPSLIVSIWFLGGLGLFCQGVTAVYLSKVFSETKRRPYTVVRARYGRCASSGAFQDDDDRRTRQAG
jgi:putative glycosyltransferase